MLLNADTAQIEDVNPYLIEMLGYSYEEFLGKKLWEVGAFADRAESKEMFAQLQTIGYVRYDDMPLVSKSGSKIDVEVVSNSYQCNDIKVIQCNIRNIAERKLAEAKLRRQTLLYAALSECNKAIVRCGSEQELFLQVCRAAVQFGGMKMAWVGLVDTRTATVRPAASFGDDTGYLRDIHISVHSDSPAGLGPTSVAFRNKQPYWSQDQAKDPATLPWRERAACAGFSASASLPLQSNGIVVGAFSVHCAELDPFDESARALLVEMAEDIGFALDQFDHHAQRRRTQEELAFKNTILKTQQETSLDAILVVDESGQIISNNQRFSDLWQLSPTLVGARVEAPVLQFTVAQVEDPEAFATRVRYLNEHREETSREDIVLKDGRTIDRYSAPVTGEDSRYYGRVWYFRDITERKSAERRIAYLQRLYVVLSSINTLIVHVRDREQLFQDACRIALEQGGFRLCMIAMLERSTKSIIPVASAGEDKEILTAIKDILSSTKRVANTMVARVIRESVPLVSNDLQNDNNILLSDKYAQAGLRSMAILPLMGSEKVIGILTLYASEIEFFHEEEMKLLIELAGDISFALENLDRQQKHANLARIRAVSGDINAAMLRIHGRDDLFRDVCRIAVGAGGFTLAWVGVVDEQSMQVRPVAWEGRDQDYIEHIPLSLNEADGEKFGLTGRAVREKKTMIVDDVQQDPGMQTPADAGEREFRSLVTLPLLVSDAVVGVLVLYASEIDFFDASEMKLLLELTANISFALDHIEKAKKLDYLAYYDPLTGLANRSLFIERVAQYMRSAASGGQKLALFLIDLERFKNVNDSLGWPAGDALLRQVAQWLTRNAGDPGLVARVGTDHFAVVLPAVRQDGDLVRLLEHAIASFLEHPFRLNDAVIRVSAKVGIALCPDDGSEAEILFRSAEAALKRAKVSGEPYLFHTRKISEMVVGKLTLENQLRQALDHDEFVLHYQPKMNIASGKLTGAEALIRWNHPRTGLVPPGQFIPILEETGLIHQVGRWALLKSISDYLRWRRAGLAPVPIAVNVSPRQLRHRGFIEEIKQAIGVDARAAAGLELEITETVIMGDLKGNIESLQAIRALGVGIAIDDFGTGFSSLSYLTKLPVDTLKIDRSFVLEMTASPEGLALVSAIISLAHSLRLKVVAEGVETEEQSRLLRLLNCDEMQGFLISKALPADVFETRFLARP